MTRANLAIEERTTLVDRVVAQETRVERKQARVVDELIVDVDKLVAFARLGRERKRRVGREPSERVERARVVRSVFGRLAADRLHVD